MVGFQAIKVSATLKQYVSPGPDILTLSQEVK